MKSNKWIFILGILLIGCAGEDIEEDENHTVQVPARISSPLNEAQYIIGDEVSINIDVEDPSMLSNLELFVDDTLFATGLELKSQTINFSTENARVGFIPVRLTYKDKDGKNHSDSRTLIFFSDIIPTLKTAKIINTYPHSPSSYTQGLEFYKGKLFESTGRNGESFIGEIDLKTAAIIRQQDLDPTYFGEGLTILNDTIYQITWQGNNCILYDMDFNKITTFSYDGEGWGLTNDGKNIIMSNGSADIVWRDPRTFQIIKTINVFDNETSLGNLNELELIDGILYANIYTEDRIVAIDTSTGKVLTYIDCLDLVADGKVAGADVLNGIAYDTNSGKTYMTGKWWPKLYEVIFE